jgi:hypothetical protein
MCAGGAPLLVKLHHFSLYPGGYDHLLLRKFIHIKIFPTKAGAAFGIAAHAYQQGHPRLPSYRDLPVRL